MMEEDEYVKEEEEYMKEEEEYTKEDIMIKSNSMSREPDLIEKVTITIVLPFSIRLIL